MDKISQIKEKFNNEAESIIANGLGLAKKGKKYHCPNTFAHKNGDRDPSMSWDPKAQQFYCFGCGMKVDIYGYYREHLNYTHQEIVSELLSEDDYKDTSIQKNRDKFTDEVKKVQPITKECIDYIRLRGINEDTIKRFNLGTYKGEIAFPYYRYETVIGYKTRKPKKNPGKPKMKNITGSKPYLYNIQNTSPGMELVICEGEFDAMIISQCGYENVVSVGAGANSLPTLVEQAGEFLNKFESLIIVSDNDEAGSNMDRYFIEKFKEKAKLIDKKLYKRKDINEEYILYGKEKIVEIIESARFKIEGRWDLDKKPYEGIDTQSGKYVPTGLPSIDYALNDLVPGFTTLITGRSNGGKSTFVRQVIVNAIDKGNKVYLMNGEENKNKVVNKLYQCVIGRDKGNYDSVKINKRYKKEPKPNVLKKLREWHKEKLVLFNKGDSKLKTIDELINMLELEIKINNYNLIVIDNLMSILSVKAAEKYEQQADFMQRLHDLADNYNTHIVLVLHPNKTYRKGQSMDMEQISGTSDLYNKADNIISVVREYEEEKINLGVNGEISVIKNRDFDDLPKVDVHFDKDTGLLLEIDEETNQAVGYSFNWDKSIPNGFQIATDVDCPF
ncbi:DnaB-like helicase C-terminal domain-containing protein [Senegalia massiliensis]|uniref:DnaB-like helicase C-terminal domain-containing protein n=1 Tax=Senegalia massiliensis TaxID=1720316 RepID=UPI00102FB52E|nr:DnaB-like helicase C-terminal domain-containing protein [Senegalia massiliensis]